MPGFQVGTFPRTWISPSSLLWNSCETACKALPLQQTHKTIVSRRMLHLEATRSDSLSGQSVHWPWRAPALKSKDFCQTAELSCTRSWCPQTPQHQPTVRFRYKSRHTYQQEKLHTYVTSDAQVRLSLWAAHQLSVLENRKRLCVGWKK